jgi:hypothetical protein
LSSNPSQAAHLFLKTFIVSLLAVIIILTISGHVLTKISYASNSVIDLSPTSGPINETVDVSGSGFGSDLNVNVYFNNILNATTQTNSGGSFTATIIVPKDPSGPYIVNATDSSGNNATKSFTIVSPSLNLSPEIGIVGTTLTVTGNNFEAQSGITLTYDAGTIVTNPSTIKSSFDGYFSATFTIPQSVYGGNEIVVTDPTGDSVPVQFDVIPSIQLSPTAGPIGSMVAVTGFGFSADSTITLTFDGSVLSTTPSSVTSNSSGSFVAQFTVPSTSETSNTVTASDSSSHKTSEPFSTTSVSITLNLEPNSGSQVLSSSNFFLVNYTENGTPYSLGAYQATTSFIADAGTDVTIAPASSSSSSSEQWCISISGATCSQATFEVSSSASITFYYYDMLSQSFSSSVVGQSLPSEQYLNYFVAPASSSGTDSPASESILLSTSMQTIWAIRGTSATVSQTISGSSGERWETSSYSWLIDNSNSIPSSITYYQQFSQSVAYKLSSGQGAQAPALTYAYLGSSTTANLGTSAATFWIDEGTTASVTNPLVGSNSQERWAAPQSSWTASGTNALPSIITYYDQYSLTIGFSVIDGGSLQAPSFTYTSFGSQNSEFLSVGTFTFWLDSGTTYSLPTSLQGSSATERYVTETVGNGTASSAQSQSRILSSIPRHPELFYIVWRKSCVSIAHYNTIWPNGNIVIGIHDFVDVG